MQSNELIHIKVALNNEFRRFSLDTPSFLQLETTIRNLCSLHQTQKLKICYIDDEKDSVMLSSDEEFCHAIDIARPLKLVVTLDSQPAQEPSLNPDGCPRGNGRCGRGNHKWGEEERKNGIGYTKDEKLKYRIQVLSERIKEVELFLAEPDLPVGRQRTLTWKLEKLKNKQQTFQHWLENPNSTSECPGNLRGRGCRGGRGRGGRFDSEKKWFQIPDSSWENLRTCLENLRTARQSGNPEETEKAKQALQKAKIQKWEAKMACVQTSKNHAQEKMHKRECLKSLREAKASGDLQKIDECQKALAVAKEALVNAKLEEKAKLEENASI